MSDGAHSPRYAPYSPNSGFYYVRQNERTKYFFEVFVRTGDLIVGTYSTIILINFLLLLTIAASGSHQSVLNGKFKWWPSADDDADFLTTGLLTEHSSSRGLRVKVFQRDSDMGREFPGGYHYHNRKSFMKEILHGKRVPYIFHMSWTKNKENKHKFFQQMGEWFVDEKCVSKSVEEMELEDGKDVPSQCCSAEPILKCHYRDKPSKNSCKDSPPIDANGRSFW